MLSFRLQWGVVVSLLCAAVPAKAEGDALPRMLTTRLELQTDHMVAGRGEDSLYPFSMHGQLRLNDWLSAELEGSLLVATTPVLSRGPSSGQTKTASEFGNLTVGASYLKMFAPNVAFSIGLSVAVPSEKHRADSLDSERRDAAVRRDGLEVHLFQPQTTFLRLPMELEILIDSIGRFRGRLTPVIWIPSDSLPTESTAVSIENWEEMTIESGWGMFGGLRVQAAFGLREATPEGSGLMMDVAVSPFIGFEPGSRGATCRLSLLLPVIGEQSLVKHDSAVMLQGMVGLVF